MSLLRRVLVLVVAFAAMSWLAAVPASASSASVGGVYVISNQVAGNAVIAYDRAASGALSLDDTYPTGGTGTGGGLGSQGAVVRDGRLLYVVNPGSDSITSFKICHDGLERVETIGSGGDMPTSLTVDHGVVYVLNAGGSGNISGFTTRHGDLAAIAGSTRPLSGAATAPAQVSFTPDGSQLIVAERATNSFSMYWVDGSDAAHGPKVVPSAGTTPFGFGFDNKRHAIVSEAFGGAVDASAVSSYDVKWGALDPVSPSVGTTETAACWIAVTGDGKYAYAGNAGSNSVSGYSVSSTGELSLLDADGKTGNAAAGVTDLAVSGNSQYLYARVGNGTVAGYAINADGSLSALGAFPGLPAGAAGIAAK